MTKNLNFIARNGCTLATALCALASQAATGPDLTAISLEELMGLKVVGASKYEQDQREVAAAVSVITREDIRSFGWRTLAEALSSLPGIHTTYDRQYTYLGTRGFGLPGDNNSRVLVTVNGNRVNDAAYDSARVGGQFLLDMDLVERIELIPGPGGAVYGQNAMFGVVNVVTRTGLDMDATELAFHAEQPQRLRQARVSFGRRFDDGTDLLVSATALNARGQDHFFDFGATGVSGVARGMDGERDREFFLRLARGNWSMDVTNGNDRKDDPTATYMSDPLAPGLFQRDRYTLAQLQFQSIQPADALQFHARIFAGQQHYQGQFSYGGMPRSYPVISDWHGAEGRVLFNGLEHHKVMLGVEVQDDTHSEQLLPHPTDPTRMLGVQSLGMRGGIYLQDDWRLADTLQATLGLRVDHNRVSGTQASPRAALIWQAAMATTLKALYGRAHRAPNTFERVVNESVSQGSSSILGGETIDTLELVAEQRVGPELLLRSAIYQWCLSDLIALGVDPVSGSPHYQTGGPVRARGLELSADQVWSWGGRLRGSVSMQHVRDADGERIVNTPPLLGKLNFSAPLPLAGLHMGLELQFDGRRRTQAGTETGGYAVTNLHLGTERLAPGLAFGVGIRNLFDKHYAQPAAHMNWQNQLQQDGRSVRVEARYRF